MIYLVFAVLLLGFLYPAGKLLMDSGLGVISFCLLFMLFRVGAQLPVALIKKQIGGVKKVHLFVFVAAGMVGALLHYLEFRSLEVGLGVSTIAFIIFCHPVPGLGIRKLFIGRHFHFSDYLKVGLALIGLAFVVGPQREFFENTTYGVLIYPLGACIAISMWIFLSDVAMRLKASPIQYSFYYDLFTLLGLGTMAFINLGSAPFVAAQAWVVKDSNFLFMAGYAIVIGVLPNILFYYGVKEVDSWIAGLVLLFEPVIASVFGTILFGEKIGLSFVIGSSLILAANLKRGHIAKILTSFKTQRGKKAVQKGAMVSVLVLSPLVLASPKTDYPSLKVCHVSSSVGDILPRANQGKAQYGGFQLAIDEFQKKNPHHVVQWLVFDGTGKTSSDGVFWASENNCDLIVGLVSSRDAIIAARALKKKKIFAYSSTASSDLVAKGLPYFKTAAIKISDVAGAIIKHAEKKKIPNVYLIYKDDEVFSLTYFDHMKEHPRVVPLLLKGNRLSKEQLSQINHDNRALVFYSTYPIESAPSITQLAAYVPEENRDNIILVGNNAWMENHVLKTLKDELGKFENRFLFTAWDRVRGKRGFNQFASKYKKLYRKKPDHDSSYDYDVMTQSLRCFKNKSAGSDLTMREHMFNCLGSLKSFTGVAGKYKYIKGRAHPIRPLTQISLNTNGMLAPKGEM